MPPKGSVYLPSRRGEPQIGVVKMHLSLEERGTGIKTMNEKSGRTYGSDFEDSPRRGDIQSAQEALNIMRK